MYLPDGLARKDHDIARIVFTVIWIHLCFDLVFRPAVNDRLVFPSSDDFDGFGVRQDRIHDALLLALAKQAIADDMNLAAGAVLAVGGYKDNTEGHGVAIAVKGVHLVDHIGVSDSVVIHTTGKVKDCTHYFKGQKKRAEKKACKRKLADLL